MISTITNIKSIFTWDPMKDQINEITGKNIVIDNGIIQEICETIPDRSKKIDAEGSCITPGFIDCHTHPVFLNGRSNEFNMRISGKSYQDIENAGGGIKSTVFDVQNSNYEQLYEKTLENIESLFLNGSTSIEAKSGYGLTLDDEIKSLRVLKDINQNTCVDIFPTFMGAHAFPQGFEKKRDKYVDMICDEMIPKVAEEKLATYCDVFCENGFFTVNQSRKILETGLRYGLLPRLHADEFMDSGAAELAVEIGAISADHLMKVSNRGIKKLADSNVIATLLPGTTLFLGQDKYANGKKMIENGIEIALATDFNPGSSTIKSLPTIMFLGCLYCGLSIEKAFKAVTYSSAKAVNSEKKIGLIKKNYKADLIFWNIENINEIPYWFSSERIKLIMKDGKITSNIKNQK